MRSNDFVHSWKPARFTVVTAAIALLGIASPAPATQIIYQLTGVASGTLGGTPFTNVLVTETLIGDTANVTAAAGLCPTCLVNLGTTTTVNIPGIGTATVTDPDGIFSSVTSVTPQGGFPSGPYVVFATLDNPPATDSITGFGIAGSSDLLGYDLRTPIGPITAIGGVGRGPQDFVNTTLGKLTFASNFLPTGQGTFTATAPEPATLALLCIGLAGLGFAWRRKH
jgi:hypothetical protein